MSEPVTRFCKDCKWVKRGWFDVFFGYRFARCAHPTQVKVGEDYLVTGNKTVKPELYCSTQRQASSSKRCGAEGRLWEPKKVGHLETEQDGVTI